MLAHIDRPYINQGFILKGLIILPLAYVLEAQIIFKKFNALFHNTIYVDYLYFKLLTHFFSDNNFKWHGGHW